MIIRMGLLLLHDIEFRQSHVTRRPRPDILLYITYYDRAFIADAAFM